MCATHASLSLFSIRIVWPVLIFLFTEKRPLSLVGGQLEQEGGEGYGGGGEGGAKEKREGGEDGRPAEVATRWKNNTWCSDRAGCTTSESRGEGRVPEQASF